MRAWSLKSRFEGLTIKHRGSIHSVSPRSGILIACALVSWFTSVASQIDRHNDPPVVWLAKADSACSAYDELGCILLADALGSQARSPEKIRRSRQIAYSLCGVRMSDCGYHEWLTEEPPSYLNSICLGARRADVRARACARRAWAMLNRGEESVDSASLRKTFERACRIGDLLSCRESDCSSSRDGRSCFLLVSLGGPPTIVSPLRARRLLRRACELGFSRGCGSGEPGKEELRLDSHSLVTTRSRAILCDGFPQITFALSPSRVDPYACVLLANQYLSGYDVPIDVEHASELLRVGCSAGMAKACMQLGLALRSTARDGVNRNAADSALSVSVALDSAYCILERLAGCIGFASAKLSGIGTFPDTVIALRLLESACSRFHVSIACRRLAEVAEILHGRRILNDNVPHVPTRVHNYAARIPVRSRTPLFYEHALGCDWGDFRECFAYARLLTGNKLLAFDRGLYNSILRSLCDGDFLGKSECEATLATHNSGLDSTLLPTASSLRCSRYHQPAISCFENALARFYGEEVARDLEEATVGARASCQNQDARGCDLLGEIASANQTGTDVIWRNWLNAIDLGSESCRLGFSLGVEKGCNVVLRILRETSIDSIHEDFVVDQLGKECGIGYKLACENVTAFISGFFQRFTSADSLRGMQLSQRACHTGAAVAEACAFLASLEESWHFGIPDTLAARENYEKSCRAGNEHACGRYFTLLLPPVLSRKFLDSLVLTLEDSLQVGLERVILQTRGNQGVANWDAGKLSLRSRSMLEGIGGYGFAFNFYVDGYFTQPWPLKDCDAYFGVAMSVRIVPAEGGIDMQLDSVRDQDVYIGTGACPWIAVGVWTARSSNPIQLPARRMRGLDRLASQLIAPLVESSGLERNSKIQVTNAWIGRDGLHVEIMFAPP
jgi:TPR repeat protein